MALEENFAEEIEACIESSEKDDLAVAEAEAPAEPEVVTHTTQEGGETTYDLPSELGPEELEAEITSVDTDAGDPGTEASENGTEGDADEGEETPAATAPAISNYAMSRAADVGISNADASEFGSTEQLLAEIRHLEGQNYGGPTRQEWKENQEPAPEAPRSPVDDLPDLDPEVFDPKTVEMFAAVKGALKQQQETIASFQDAQDAAAASSQAAANHETKQWFDSEIKGLGESFGEILGQGNFDSLAPGSSQLAKRDEIASLTGVLFAGYRDSGQQMPPREDIFRAAARLVLADEYQSLHDKEVSSGLEKRSGQHISRVTGKKSSLTRSPEDADKEIAALIDSEYGT